MKRWSLRTLYRGHAGCRDSRSLVTRIGEVERRLGHLESVLEGLQDAVYREAVRQDKQIDELTQNTQPAAMARALSADARQRGV